MKLWEAYCQRQAYAGSSEQYYIDKYGEEQGRAEWKRLCESKAHNLENIMRRYNVDEEGGIEILSSIMSRTKSGYSKASQLLFWRLYELLDDADRESCYFAELNMEFGKYDRASSCYRKYDFALTNKKVIIEYNGDHYHANPRVFRPDDVTFYGKAAKDIWIDDEIKAELVRELGFKLIIVWESDWLEKSEAVIERVLYEINRA